MIKIVITKTTVTEYEEMTNILKSKTPTPIKGQKDRYSDEAPLFAEEYSVQPVRKTKTETVNLLEQQIEKDGEFDLAEVIKAVNRL